MRDERPSLPNVINPSAGAAIALDRTPVDSQPQKPFRLKLWQLTGNLECSLVGTCLSQQDLFLILKRSGLRAQADIKGYDLHAYVVTHLAIDGPLPRAVHRLLDRRHEGILRKIGRTTDTTELEQIWQREYDAGRVPGAYWAFMTHGHIPYELGKHIFGEVHMLSHVLGRTTHTTAERASELEAKVADLESKLARLRDRHEAAIKARDEKITQLSSNVAIVVPQSNSENTSAHLAGSRPNYNDDKRNRALLVARQRARLAEAQLNDHRRDNERLAEQCRRLSARLDTLQAPEVCPGAIACRLDLPSGERPRVLYLGGRTGSIDQLRAIAEQASADFYHHDGGKEHAFRLIEELIGRCHLVVCPIDCINHRACILAKGRCKSLNKAFVPLRSSGGSEFKRALSQLLPA
ncbi:MAG: DUF2325 domain-containing protein [Hyphomicrobiaceae bacterium]